MHNSYVKGEEHWTKVLSAALNVLVNWKGGNSPPSHKYEYREGVDLKNKGNAGGLMGDCYNCGKFWHMVWDCT